jgi:hypothetical protein
MKTKKILVDDHPQLVEAALAILKPHYDIVGIATDGAMWNSRRRKPKLQLCVAL